MACKPHAEARICKGSTPNCIDSKVAIAEALSLKLHLQNAPRHDRLHGLSTCMEAGATGHTYAEKGASVVAAGGLLLLGSTGSFALQERQPA